MLSRSYKLVRAGLVASGLVILVIGATAARLTVTLVHANAWVRHTTDVIGEVRATRMLLGIAAVDSRADGLKFEALQQQLGRVARLTSDNPWQQKNIAEFHRRVERGGLAAGGGLAPGALEEGNVILDRMQREEYGLLLQRSGVQATAMEHAGIAISSLCVALLSLGLLTSFTARSEYWRRLEAEQVLQKEKEELIQYSDDLARVSSGSELIQTVEDEQALSEAVGRIMQGMLPGSLGYIGITDASHDTVQIAQRWGAAHPVEQFEACDCAALRLGRQIHASEDAIHTGCGHIRPGAGDSLCIPVRSATGHLAVLHIETPEKLSKKRVAPVSLFASHVGLTLTNLRVRASLRSQTIRDSLTGLFNRRYFDETLQRELVAARRDGECVCILMIDLDNFKGLNDSFGHAAGDQALRNFSALMRSAFRESDVLCRYGGEEFAVILRGASPRDAFHKSEHFRKTVELSRIAEDVSRITTSVGLACSSEFETAAHLVAASDQALYHAKRNGRNATWMCSNTLIDLPTIPPVHGASRTSSSREFNDTALTSPRAAGPARAAADLFSANTPPA